LGGGAQATGHIESIEGSEFIHLYTSKTNFLVVMSVGTPCFGCPRQGGDDIALF
jgi:hypothetical protein